MLNDMCAKFQNSVRICTFKCLIGYTKNIPSNTKNIEQLTEKMQTINMTDDIIENIKYINEIFSSTLMCAFLFRDFLETPYVNSLR